MVGCTCDSWEDEWAFSGIDPTLKYEDGFWQELTRRGWEIIIKCPWCGGTPLTPPKEVK